MFLYLLRHGEAHPDAIEDSARRLTDKGLADVQKVASLFRDRAPQLDCCLTSPYVRTRETAAAFLEVVKPDLQANPESTLTPEHRAFEVMALLDRIPEQCVLLVGHNPLVSELHALLTGNDLQERHILGTSELVCIKMDYVGAGQGQVSFTLHP